ncbi:phytoene/squalene synthase family protein [Rhabdothermincola sp.]|uniref:phytoene/squalene synthase family protein n=1 Tax=Rhabdothermincola sp. TaxID=2820405 RepID=UPI002FE10D95
MTTLEQSYTLCRSLNRRHGTTYYWAGFVLPAVKRHHVWALYAFCRFADEIVDAPGWRSVDDRRAALDRLAERFFTDLAAGRSEHPVLKAVVHTVHAFDIDAGLFRRFLRSMAMDLTVERYETYADLEDYMDGSASVIGEMMLPLLEPSSPEAVRPARALGEAFQLTNFLRDVGEDLDRGRVYLPQEDLQAFGADPARRRVDPAWVALMRFEIERARALYAEAERGIPFLPPSSARCITTASALYGGILRAIERNGYDVFSTRARVPAVRKAAAVGRALLAARWPSTTAVSPAPVGGPTPR